MVTYSWGRRNNVPFSDSLQQRYYIFLCLSGYLNLTNERRLSEEWLCFCVSFCLRPVSCVPNIASDSIWWRWRLFQKCIECAKLYIYVFIDSKILVVIFFPNGIIRPFLKLIKQKILSTSDFLSFQLHVI
jgi:hypothetical protein